MFRRLALVMVFVVTIAATFQIYEEAKRAEAVLPAVAVAIVKEVAVMGSAGLVAAGLAHVSGKDTEAVTRHVASQDNAAGAYLRDVNSGQVVYRDKNGVINKYYGGVDPYPSGTKKAFVISAGSKAILKGTIASLGLSTLCHFLIHSLDKDDWPEAVPYHNIIVSLDTFKYNQISYPVNIDLTGLDNATFIGVIDAKQGTYKFRLMWPEGVLGPSINYNNAYDVDGVKIMKLYIERESGTTWKEYYVDSSGYKHYEWTRTMPDDYCTAVMFQQSNTGATYFHVMGGTSTDYEVETTVQTPKTSPNPNFDTTSDSIVLVPNDIEDLANGTQVVKDDPSIVPETPVDSGSSILEVIKSMYNYVINLPQNIANAIKDVLRELFGITIDVPAQIAIVNEHALAKMRGGQHQVGWLDYLREGVPPKWYIENTVTHNMELMIDFADYDYYIYKIKSYCGAMMYIYVFIWFIRSFKPTQTID